MSIELSQALRLYNDLKRKKDLNERKYDIDIHVSYLSEGSN